MSLLKLLNERSLSLEAPVLRVTAPDTIYPFAAVEDDWLPDYKEIIETAKKVINF